MTPGAPARTVLTGTRALDLAVSENITQGVIATWSSLLHRAPRVLVPVQVDALMVPVTGGSWADCKVQDAAQAPVGGNRQQLAPDPFSARAARPAGIYLHWALPSALTRGTTVTNSMSANNNRVDFPPIPDRWLVVRLFHQPGDRQRSIAGWVLQTQGTTATAVDLAGWIEPGADPQSANYTAAQFGNATWSAYFDNVENRLAFHDSLIDIKRASIGYLVAGWYADETLDPLAGPFTQSASDFEEKLAANGWSLSDDDFDQAWQDAYDYATSARSVGLNVNVPPSSRSHPAEWGSEFGAVTGDRSGPSITQPPPAWPRQSLLHGSVVGLSWDTTAATPSSSLPHSRALEVVIDRTVSEAMGTLLAAHSGNAEEARLLAAFQLGSLDDLDQADGRSRLEAGIHAATFRSFDGGRVAEHRLPNTKPLAAEARRKSLASGVTKVPPRPKYETVYRGLPRLYEPHDPVLLISGGGRSFKHGKDGRFESDGTLRCRLAPSCVTGVSTAAAGNARAYAARTGILAATLHNGSIPVECNVLLDELALLDPGSAGFMAGSATGGTGMSSAELAARFQTEQTAWWNLRGRDFDPRMLAAYSGIAGTMPSPVAVTPAHQPWEPRHLEWEVAYAPSLAGISAWSLGELDYALTDARTTSLLTYRGRATLTGGTAATLAAAARRAADLATTAGAGGGGGSGSQASSSLAQSLADALATQADLKVLSDDLAQLDCVAGALDGFLNRLRDEPGGNVVTQSGDTYDDPKIVGPHFQALRAGTMRLTRLRLVDAWGQYVDLIKREDEKDTSRLIIGAAMASPLSTSPASTIVLPPRLTAPSQVSFRFLSATDDTKEATETVSPVVGYLMPKSSGGIARGVLNDRRGDRLGAADRRRSAGHRLGAGPRFAGGRRRQRVARDAGSGRRHHGCARRVGRRRRDQWRRDRAFGVAPIDRFHAVDDRPLFARRRRASRTPGRTSDRRGSRVDRARRAGYCRAYREPEHRLPGPAGRAHRLAGRPVRLFRKRRLSSDHRRARRRRVRTRGRAGQRLSWPSDGHGGILSRIRI